MYKKLKRWFHRYINGTKGVISLFLALLMAPFATIAVSLINAARINSAVAVFDEALCNASNSTLGTYDEFLKQRFGLLAMDQNTASGGSGYSVQDFLSDTYEFYMDENLGALSNTYKNINVSASGEYPLADKNVLLAQVLETSKYSVPTKLVIDGLSLDDLVKELTKSMDFGAQIFGTFSSGAAMTDEFATCDEKIVELQKSIETYEKAEDAYNAAYTDFSGAVNGYNTLIDEYSQKMSEKQSAVDIAQGTYDGSQNILSAEEEKVSDILQNIEDMETNGESAESINEYEKEHEKELDAYKNAKKNFDTASNDLSSAKNELDDVIAQYETSLNGKRNNVTTYRTTYAEKIGEFADAALKTGDAVKATQDSLGSVIDSSTNFLDDMTTSMYEEKKQGIKKEIEALEKNQDDAKKRGDDEAYNHYHQQYLEADGRKTDIENNNKLENARTDTPSEATVMLENFISEDYQDIYASTYNKLIELKVSVENYVIHTDTTTKLEDTSSLYVAIENMLVKEDIENLQQTLSNEIAESSFFAFIKAIAGFVNAIFTLTTWYDPELCADINEGNFSSIGGLPSGKDRSEGSEYSLKSEFTEMDSQQSEHYKELLGAYSNNPDISGSASVVGNFIETILNDINTISECCKDWSWKNVFSKLCTLTKALCSIVWNILDLITGIQSIIDHIIEKTLLTGYVAYNTSNRTTYTGSALTGAGYSLPNVNSNHQGYAFYGAETEYIIAGTLSEIVNQTIVFYLVYAVRMIWNIAPVLSNSEVETLAMDVLVPTFGIGTVVVYVLYVLAEAFVDTLILVNSGSIPIIKTQVFLTPSGLPDLIGSFVQLSISEAAKESIYNSAVEVASNNGAENKLPDDYKTATESHSFDKLGKFGKTWEIDYTKTLLIVMMLFKSSDTMLDHLADIIQMEGSYNSLDRVDQYAFNLDKSYTYLRAEGEFEGNEFIKISNGSSLNSKKRVIYRGY